MKIVLKESDEKAKYELFMRLNTGGSVPSAQEVRNCLMVMAFPETYEWIRTLSDVPEFRHTLSLSDRNVDEQYPMELATRFLTFRTLPEDKLSAVGDISDFLNDQLESLHKMNAEQKTVEERAFRETFRLLDAELEDDAFTRFDSSKGRFSGGFSISAFEVIAMGIGHSVRTDSRPNVIHGLKRKVQGVWSNEVFKGNSGSGVRASVRIPKLVPLGRRIFANAENPQSDQPGRRARR